MRPSARAYLSVMQFENVKIEVKLLWNNVRAIGNSNGAAKEHLRDWMQVGKKPPAVCVGLEYLEGAVNFYQQIDQYMTIRDYRNVRNDRFFLCINKKRGNHKGIFRRQAVGRNTFVNTVKAVCEREAVCGSGTNKMVVTHGQRWTFSSILLKAFHADSSLQTRTSHQDLRSLQIYKNLRGLEDLRQQSDILGSSQQDEAATEGGSSACNDSYSTEGKSMNLSHSDSLDCFRGVADNDDDNDGKHMQVDSYPDETSTFGLSSTIGIVRGRNVNASINYYVSQRASS